MATGTDGGVRIVIVIKLGRRKLPPRKHTSGNRNGDAESVRDNSKPRLPELPPLLKATTGLSVSRLNRYNLVLPNTLYISR